MNINQIALATALILLTVPGSGVQSFDKTEIISLPKTAAVLEAAARLHLDLLSERDGRIFVVAPPDIRRIIEAEGLAYLLETERFAPAAAEADSPLLSSPIGDYHTHQELEDDLYALEAGYPGLAKVVTIGYSLENRTILALKVSDNVEADEGEPGAIFLGCHHAREWISVEVPFLFGKHLLEHYTSDPEVRRLVDSAEIWVVPMVNPDGHDFSVRVYRYWRKNRRQNSNGTFGVDPNRNYGFAWGFDNTGSSPNPNSDVYRGTAAFSEPETAAVRDFVLSRNFGSMVSYHSFSQLIMYPWAYADIASAREAEFIDLTARMAELMAAVNGRVYGTGRSGETLYVVNGDTGDWAYAETGMASLCIELPPLETYQGAFFNAEADIAGIFAENLPAMLYLVDWTLTHPNPGPEPGLVNPRPLRPERKRGPGPIR
ncbi:MAG: zinc carboxypeptidase [Candidatus Aminicenantes bacterium]|nr:zinc carboxypeptidase [Candidatus Aminicenantes bacterium]